MHRYNQLLELYRSKDELRQWLCKPFNFNGNTCASNASAIVILPFIGTHPDMSEKISPIYPTERNTAVKFSLNSLKWAYDKSPMIEAPCDCTGKCNYCNGIGEVPYEHLYEGSYVFTDGDCPQCDGLGRIDLDVKPDENGEIPDMLALVEIEGYYIPITRIYELIRTCEILECDTINLVHTGNNLLFSLGNVEIVVAHSTSESSPYCKIESEVK